MNAEKAKEILEISGELDALSLKKAYLKQIRQYHPDTYHAVGLGEQDANDLTVDINEAYQYLQDWLKRGRPSELYTRESPYNSKSRNEYGSPSSNSSTSSSASSPPPRWQKPPVAGQAQEGSSATSRSVYDSINSQYAKKPENDSSNESTSDFAQSDRKKRFSFGGCFEKGCLTLVVIQVIVYIIAALFGLLSGVFIK